MLWYVLSKELQGRRTSALKLRTIPQKDGTDGNSKDDTNCILTALLIFGFLCLVRLLSMSNLVYASKKMLHYLMCKNSCFAQSGFHQIANHEPAFQGLITWKLLGTSQFVHVCQNHYEAIQWEYIIKCGRYIGNLQWFVGGIVLLLQPITSCLGGTYKLIRLFTK